VTHVTSAELRELARLYSIQLRYEDAAGKTRTASRESLLAALRARIPEGMSLARALRLRRDQRVEPVTVVWGEGKPRIALRNVDRADYELTLETGERSKGQLVLSRGQATLDRRLPFGYHLLRINRKHETALFVAPRTAPAVRQKGSAGSQPAGARAASPRRQGAGDPAARVAALRWGVFAPLYAMHTDHTWGMGDLYDMHRYQEWVRNVGGSFVATLPMNAIFAGSDPSPYAPVSRLFWNEMYLDVTRLPEYRGEPLEPLPLPREIEYQRVAQAKGRLLYQLAERFFERPDDAFGEFASKANEYALFRARAEATSRPWREWTDDDEFGFDVARYHLYVQYRMEQQMRELPEMVLDFPLGVNPDGYDAWRFSDHFAKGVSVGAPPDPFFTRGQNWGFPPLDPDAIRQRHHSYFRACIRHQLAHAAILRIDHVMGLHRLFWIPAGGEPKDGLYVRYPADELYAILMIESHRSNSIIVGEDLGTVPAYVPQTMKRHGIRRMYVLQYEAKPQGRNPVGVPPGASVASINTHDMPTFASYWGGKDIDDRLEQGLLDASAAAEERAKRQRIRDRVTTFLTARGLLGKAKSETIAVLEALLRFLGSSDAEFVLVNLEDCWLEEEPQNVPGMPERSWKRKMRKSLEEARGDATVIRLLAAVNESRRGRDGHEK
jgi:4-alpha-glucanotransferase